MRKLYLILIIILLLFPFNIVNASNANTLAELRSELSSLKSKKSKQDSEKAKTKSELNNAQNNIYITKTQIDEGREKIENAKAEIVILTSEIEEGKETVKKLMNSYQILEDGNSYIDYLFNSQSYADLVYRYTVIDQIINYNSDLIEEWKANVIYNEELQIELAAKEEELNKQVASLEKEVSSLGKDLAAITDITMDIQDEINSTQELINFYKNMGCGENENLEQCVAVRGDTKFRKPVTKGTITSYFGYRLDPIKKQSTKFHAAIDIGGNSQGTNVYSAANGMVGKIVRKASCGGNEVFIYHTIGGTQYTTFYFHLLDIKVSVGDNVTSATVIGTVGGGSKTPWDGCSTGPHLHFGIATGWYGKTYSSYSTMISRTIDPQKTLNLPKKGTYWYSR